MLNAAGPDAQATTSNAGARMAPSAQQDAQTLQVSILCGLAFAVSGTSPETKEASTPPWCCASAVWASACREGAEAAALAAGCSEVPAWCAGPQNAMLAAAAPCMGMAKAINQISSVLTNVDISPIYSKSGMQVVYRWPRCLACLPQPEPHLNEM